MNSIPTFLLYIFTLSTSFILSPPDFLVSFLQAQQCFDPPQPFQYSSDSSCSNPTKQIGIPLPSSSSLVQLGSNSKILTFDTQFRIMSRCSSASTPSTLFALQVTSAIDPPLVSYQYDESSGNGVDYSFTLNVNGSPYSQIFNIPGSLSMVAIKERDLFEILFSINFYTNDNIAFLTLPNGIFKKVLPNAADFSGLEFDSTTTFTFCGDPNTLETHFYCAILNLQTWYTSYTDLGTPFYPGDVYRNPFTFDISNLLLASLQAYYATDENLGWTLTDSVGSFGDANLGDYNGDFAPAWSNSALVFTTGTEFITLPSFFVFETCREYSNSFTISFWIKIGDGTNSGVLFSRKSTSGEDLTTITLGADGKVTAQILGSQSANAPSIQSSQNLPVNIWNLLIVTFQTDTTQISSYFTIYFGNVLQASSLTTSDPVSFTAYDLVQMGGNLALDKPLYIAKISIFSPGSNYVGDSSSCSDPSSSCQVTVGAFDIVNCLFDQSMCHSTCATCSGPMPEACLTCPSDRYLNNGYCVSNCFIYSDGSCLTTCATPYTPRIEEYTAYCDFGCDSTHYLYPDKSCLSTCPKPAKNSSPRTNENLCKGPCDNPDSFYYPDLNTCAASCSSNYLQDSSTAFYKQCILTTVSTTTKNVIKTTEKAGTAAKTVTQVTTAISSGSPLGVSAAVAGKIFSNIKYLNITYSVELQNALLTWKSTFISLSFLPDMPLTFENELSNRPVPYMFEKYGIVSSFLINCWENIFFLVILLVLYLVSRLMERAISKYSTPKALRIMVQNFLFTQLYSFYGDILFYSTIEYRSQDFHGLAGVSFFVSCSLLVIMFACFISHFCLLKKYQKIKLQAQNSDDKGSLEKFIESKNGQEVLFRDFKDKSLLYQSFLLLLTARDLAFSLILTTLFNHPLAQIIIILILNVAMFGYLLLRPPLTSQFDGAQQLYYEFITLSVNVSVMILAILDEIGSIGVDLRTNIGRFIISINMCFNFGALLFMMISLGIRLKEIYQEYKAKSGAKKLPRQPSTRPITPQPGEQVEVKDLSLDESHHQLVKTSLAVHDISPVRIESEIQKPAAKNSQRPKNFRFIEIGGPPSQDQKHEFQLRPKGELENPTLSLKKIVVKPSLMDRSQEIRFMKGSSRYAKSGEDSNRGVKREMRIEEKSFETKVVEGGGLAIQETERKRRKE